MGPPVDLLQRHEPLAQNSLKKRSRTHYLEFQLYDIDFQCKRSWTDKKLFCGLS
jgi:hypothetical protein